MRKPCYQRRPKAQPDHRRGYILITLMLFVTLMVIAAVAIYPTLVFQVQRDREEEMIHRGVQYSRAIKRYYKKFGTYPPTLDALQSTQNLRFLRKKYKDPITGQDFKILRMTDVKMSFSPGLNGAQPIAGGGVAGSPLGGGSAFGQGAAASAPAYGANALGGPNAAFNPNAQNPNPPTDAGAPGTPPADPNAPPGANPPTTAAGPASPGQGQTDDANAQPKSPFVTASGQPGGNTFGGAPIVGVTSVSKKESIRIFSKKNHYNEWQFIYDPTTDRGGMLNAPVQPGLQQGVVAPVQGPTGNPGAFGTGSTGSNGPGVAPGFGTPNSTPPPQN